MNGEIKILVKPDGTIETDFSATDLTPEQKRDMQKNLAKALGGTIIDESHKEGKTKHTVREREQA